jgi:hypothetical protein
MTLEISRVIRSIREMGIVFYVLGLWSARFKFEPLALLWAH